MALDPVRAALVRKMVSYQASAAWPLRYLPMKQIKRNTIVAFGKISPDALAMNQIQVTDCETAAVLESFSNVEELISAGWAVD